MISRNPFMALLMRQQAGAAVPLPPGGGNGGGIVPTPEQEAASRAAAEYLGIPPETTADDILVRGNAPSYETPEMDPSMYNLPEGVPNLSNTAWAQEAQAANERNEKEIQHKGMFGMKGTLRDVLGLLGDSFLVQAGRDRVYAPKRQQERIGDAMAGHTQAPMAAAERVAQYDPDLGRNVANDARQNEVRRAQVESLNASREDMAATRGQARFEKARAYTAALLNAAGDDPAKIQYALQMAERAASAANVTLDDLGITENMTPEQLQVYSDAGMTVNQQEGWPRRDRSLDQGDSRIGVSQQRAAETARHNRVMEARPRGGSSGKNPTNASLAAPLLRKVQDGKKLTPAEAETLNRLGYSPDRGRGGRGSTRRAIPNSRFRPVN